LNSRTEHHGDEDVPACDIALKNLLLNREEIEALLGEGAWDRLYAKKRNSGMNDFPEIAPFIELTKTPFELTHKFEDSRVAIFLGMTDDNEVVLERCKLARIRYEPQNGGLTLVSLQVQATPLAEDMAKLFAHMNSDAHAKVRFGKVEDKKSDKQDELELDVGAETKANGNGAEATAH
jgi:hypothetical protein